MIPDNVDIKVRHAKFLLDLRHDMEPPFTVGDVTVEWVQYQSNVELGTATYAPMNAEERLRFWGDHFTEASDVPDAMRTEWLAFMRAQRAKVLMTFLDDPADTQGSNPPQPVPQPFNGQTQKVQIPQPPGSAEPPSP